tara:strand:+ start:270 stop:938 length:669 start_codon:yes stop_codon:yes gene_type:complete
MAVNVDRMKNPRAAKQQQQGALRFYIQQELNNLQIISRLKSNLKGTAIDGQPYIHKATGRLEKSISPSKDGQKNWGKQITSKIKVDAYLGLGIGIEQVSARIDMEPYGDKLDSGGMVEVNQNEIYRWVLAKANRYPTGQWYYRGGKVSGSEMTTSAAWNISYNVTRKIKAVGVRETGWLNILKGKKGLNGALQNAFNRYLNDYDDYTYATVVDKLDKMLSKL